MGNVLYKSDLIAVSINDAGDLLHCFIAGAKPKSFQPTEIDWLIAHVKRRTGYTIAIQEVKQ